MDHASVSQESTLADLVSLWQQRRAEGQPAAPAELCRNCPELLPELERRVAALERMAELADGAQETVTLDTAGSQSVTDAPAGRPDIPGYEILGELGRGGMGVVYKARQASLNRIVALKMILAGSHAGQEAIARFLREAETIARLKHPHVVQVHEFGSHEGKPFFSLEYLEGGSLADKLRGEPQPPAQAAQIVEVLARAVEAAHRQGIVHRDLKPANVLLTTDGIPKLTDFGLAKQADSGMTATGQVLGTPSYMAPEQAGGKSKGIGPAADIYALGAILYELLTGRPPFKGTSAWDTLQMVVAAEPVAPRQLQPKVPHDLETICLKCLHKDPGRRYSSALTLADDLNRFLHGEPIHARPVGRIERGWRWCRRNRMVTALAAALSLVIVASIVGLTGLWLRAETQRDQAREAAEAERQAKSQARTNFQLARQTVEDYCLKVNANLSLRNEDLRDLRSELLRTAIKFHEQFKNQPGDEEDVKSDRAKSYMQLGGLLRDIGSPDDAIRHFEQAQALYADLASVHPTNAKYVRSHALCLVSLCVLYGRTNRIPDAEQAGQQALAAQQQLAEESPDDPNLQAELATTCDYMAALRMDIGQFAEAETLFRRALDICRKLVGKHPQVSAYKNLLCGRYNNLGVLYFRQTKLELAEKAYADALDVQRPVAAENPKDVDAQRGLALILQGYGDVYRRTGRPKQAVDAYEEVVAIQRSLMRAHPNVTGFQDQLADAYTMLASAYKLTGRYREAEEALQQGIDLLSQLTKTYPSVARFQSNLADSYNDLGVLYKHTMRLGQAETTYQKSLGLRKNLVKANPKVPNYKRDAAGSLLNLGNFYRDIGKPQQAEDSYQQAIAFLQELVAAFPKIAAYQSVLALTLHNRGKNFQDRFQLKEAETPYERAWAIRQQLVEDHPTVADYQIDLAQTCNNLGNLHKHTGRLERAEQFHQKALELRRKLAEALPDIPEYQHALAESYTNLGNLRAFTRKFSEAAESHQQALNIHLKLVKSHPTVGEYAVGLGRDYCILSSMMNETGKPKEAIDSANRGLQVLKGLQAHDPRQAEVRHVLDLLNTNLALALLRAGEWDQAAKSADEIANRSSDSGLMLYNAACVFSLASTAVEKDQKLSSPEQKQLTNQYVNRALALLRQAQSVGYFASAVAREQLSGDRDLDPLRSHAEFKKLLAGLGKAKSSAK